MRVLSTSRGRGALALGLVVLVLATLGITHRGVPAAEVDLHDGGVWVTNEALLLAGHLNYPSRTLDGGVRAGSGQFDLTQRGNDVVLHDTGGASLAPIDTANLVLANGVSLGPDFTVLQGGSTAAVLQAQQGKLWVLPTKNLSSFSPESDPAVEDPGGLRAVVGTDGLAHSIDSQGRVRRVSLADGAAAANDEGRIDGIADFAKLQVSSVGDRLVALDIAGAALRTTSGSSPLPNATDATIQQPGPNSAYAIVASPTALVWAPLAGGEPREKPNAPVTNPGLPVQPVFLNGCAYGAWTGSGAYLRDCLDDAADVTATVDRTKGAAKLRFRVNRDVIVLNDVATGLIVLVNDQMQIVDNWQTVQSQVEDSKRSDLTEEQTTTEQDPAEKTKESRPPVATPDDFGVRAGRSTTLPVLANDSDPDGDPLTATPLTAPKLGTIGQVRGGQALRIDVPADAQGSGEFKYRVDDGRGGSAETTVKVAVHPPSRNEAPRPLLTSSITVGQGDEVSYAVLPDWVDPDGDDIFLSGASGPPELAVRFRPDGLVTVRDLGTGTPGLKDVTLTLTDGTAAAQGTLKVLVKPKGDLPPVANADHAVTWKGQDVTIQPLLNDTDPNGTRPRLASVADAAPGERIRTEMAAGRVTFSSDTVGTHYVGYTISDGPNLAVGEMRIDVREPAPDAPPIADNDLALLATGGSVSVDVLANDSDPRGGVLVIQSVKVPATAPVSVEIVDHARLRISAPAGLPNQTSFAYTISNGTGSATGQVTVVPMPAAATTLPPIATDDTGTVRAGDIVTVPVLANDVSPTGLPLELQPELQIVSGGEGGVAFASGRTLRFRAGPNPGSVRITYTVQDSAGNPASAQALITITAADAPNSPPVPEPLVGRVLAGGTALIPVPTDGLDPDGDSVTLTGIGDPPSRGTATAGATAIEYTAPQGVTGSDSFTYVVTDRFGASNRGEVRIGIAPPPPTNQAPVAVPDSITVRPDRTVSVPVLANDLDPDGDTLSLIPGSVVPVDSGTPASAATVEGDRVTVQAAGPGTLRYYYDITDGRGGNARGVLSVEVDPNAPLKAPIARDDVVLAQDVAGKESIQVPVLANDEDPDGRISDATVSVNEAGATVAGGVVTVPVRDARQVILYSVTDRDGLVGRAAIIVPPGNRVPPVLIPEKVPAKIKAGDTLRVALADYVRVRAGHTAKLTFENRVKAGPGSNGAPVIADPTTLVFTPALDFSGATSLSFEVTDGTTPEDPEGLAATLVLPIEVESSGLTRPQFRPSEVTAAPLEAPSEADLATMVTDPDPGDMEKMRYTLGAIAGGFQVRLDGSKLLVSAPAGMAAGTQGTAQVTVTDGSTEPVTGQVQLRALASTRPLMTVRDVVIDNAHAGQPSQINLADYVTNPFAAENRPVTMVGAPAVTTGQGAATAAGLQVTATPAAGFNGQMVVTYRLADATQDPGRQVQGIIRLTVQDRPGPPTAVSAATQASRTATVSWTAGPANGSPITAFTVRYAGGQQTCGVVTTCTINNLVNNQHYTFTVVATNAVGDSDPSAASNDVRPDVRPNTPAAPTAVDSNPNGQQLTVTWPAATTEGSPVINYTLEIDGAVGQQQVTGLTYTWTGLTNGSSYRFRIQAHSSAEQPSEWSPYSAAVVPAGPPMAPAAPRVVKEPVSALPPSATVSWTAPSGNGDNNLTYEVRRNEDVGYWDLTALTLQVTMTGTTAPQTFQVRAINRKGPGPWSADSVPIRAFSNPGPVSGLTATPTGTDHEVRVTFGAAEGNGASTSEMRYYWTANGQGGAIPAGGGTLTSAAGFPNGQAVNLQVYAQSTVSGETAVGPTQSVSVTAYGPPRSPTMSCSGTYNAVNCNWSGGVANGRNTVYRLSDAASGDVGASGNHNFTDIGASATRRLCVQAFQDGGQNGALNCQQATSTPPSSYDWERAAAATGCPSAWSQCSSVYLTLRNYRPNSNVYCWVGGKGAPDWSATIPVHPDGNWGREITPTGSPRALRAGGIEPGPDFGTCEQR